jgi:hypothetical protein
MKALVATMGKLAEIIYHCLTRGERYEYQQKYRRVADSALFKAADAKTKRVDDRTKSSKPEMTESG